jgi:hypothetical protein
MQAQPHSKLIATPQGVFLATEGGPTGLRLARADEPLFKSALSSLPAPSVHHLLRANELCKKMTPKDWEPPAPHGPNDIPVRAQAEMHLVLFKHEALKKFNPDELRDAWGRWVAEAVGAIVPSAEAGVQTADTGEKPGNRKAVKATGVHGKVIITNDDGSREIRSGGSLSWRNNNPGNMISGLSSHPSIGMNEGRAIFPSEQAGMEAALANLQTPTYQTKTVGDAIATWAPAKDHNDPVEYAKDVFDWTGIAVDTPMKTLTPDQLQSVAKAIRRREGWWEGKVKVVEGKQ